MGGSGYRGGKYMHKDWGVVRTWTPKDWGRVPGFKHDKAGRKVGFEGSGIKHYLYFDKDTGTYHTIGAHNAKEAEQIAMSFGYQKVRKKR